jgi:predicted transcriptional regulator
MHVQFFNTLLVKLGASMSQIENYIEKIFEAQTQKIEDLEQKIEQIKSGIILGAENANRAGRPSLTNEEILFIRKLRSEGLSQRETAQIAGVGLGSVHKYQKAENPPENKLNGQERKEFELTKSYLFNKEKK